MSSLIYILTYLIYEGFYGNLPMTGRSAGISTARRPIVGMRAVARTIGTGHGGV